MKWISTASLVMALGFAWTASQAMAQQGGTAQPQSFEELSARLEQQDQQIRQLQAQMSGMQQGVNATPVALCSVGRHGGRTRVPACRQRRRVPRSAAT